MYARDRALLLEGTLTFPYTQALIWPGKKLKQTHNIIKQYSIYFEAEKNVT